MRSKCSLLLFAKFGMSANKIFYTNLCSFWLMIQRRCTSNRFSAHTNTINYFAPGVAERDAEKWRDKKRQQHKIINHLLTTT
jgi:hypothetical protein